METIIENELTSESKDNLLRVSPNPKDAAPMVGVLDIMNDLQNEIKVNNNDFDYHLYIISIGARQ